MKLDKNYKVRVNSKQSREIQELVFRLGGKWNNGTDWVINETIPFLYVTSGLVMTCDLKAQEYSGYASSENTEIQADDIITLLTDLPKSAESPLQLQVGNKVYKYGETDVKTVLEVFEGGYMRISNYPHRVNHEVLCHATPENHAVLSKPFPAIEFEQPPKPLTGSDRRAMKSRKPYDTGRPKISIGVNSMNYQVPQIEWQDRYKLDQNKVETGNWHSSFSETVIHEYLIMKSMIEQNKVVVHHCNKQTKKGEPCIGCPYFNSVEEAKEWVETIHYPSALIKAGFKPVSEPLSDTQPTDATEPLTLVERIQPILDDLMMECFKHGFHQSEMTEAEFIDYSRKNCVPLKREIIGILEQHQSWRKMPSEVQDD